MAAPRGFEIRSFDIQENGDISEPTILDIGTGGDNIEFDEDGNDLVTNLGELTPAMIAKAIGSRVLKFYDSASIRDRLAFLDAKEARLKKAQASMGDKAKEAQGVHPIQEE